MGIVVGILWLLCSGAVFLIYHKLFNVVYLDLANGCFKELIVCAIIGAVLAGLIMSFWYISIPVAILAIIAIAKKR